MSIGYQDVNAPSYRAPDEVSIRDRFPTPEALLSYIDGLEKRIETLELFEEQLKAFARDHFGVAL